MDPTALTSEPAILNVFVPLSIGEYSNQTQELSHVMFSDDGEVSL